MAIKVLVFGAAKDVIGCASFNWILTRPITVAEFKTALFEQYPELKRLTSLSLAVNEVYANEDLRLEEKDVVALIPPVSGG